ncbi:hypothetical protein WN943_027558 [Citrus x changshan-huyou]
MLVLSGCRDGKITWTRIIWAGLNPYRNVKKFGFGINFNNPDISGSGSGFRLTRTSGTRTRISNFNIIF